MGCEPFKSEIGAGLVCSRGRRKATVRPCFVRWCSGDAGKLCDYPVGDGKTCDRQCCDKHCRPVEGKPDTDYCLEHAFKKEPSSGHGP